VYPPFVSFFDHPRTHTTAQASTPWRDWEPSRGLYSQEMFILKKTQ